jgi:hypothetical protein
MIIFLIVEILNNFLVKLLLDYLQILELLMFRLIISIVLLNFNVMNLH